MPMKLTKEKRDQLILVAVGSALLVSAMWFVLISAQKAKLVDIAERTNKAKTKVEEADKKIKMAGRLETELEESTGRLKTREAEMAAGDLYSWIILTINNFGLPYKVNVPSFSPGVVGKINVLPRFPYEAALFKIGGSSYYHDLGKFIADFENRYPYIRLQSLVLSPGPQGTGGAAAGAEDQEKLAFEVEVVALIKPTTP